MTEETSRIARFTRPEPTPAWDFLAVTNTISILLIGSLLGAIVAGVWLQDSGLPFVVTGLVARAFGALAVLIFINAARRSAQDRASLRLGSAPLPLPFLILFGLGAAVTLDVLGLIVTGSDNFYRSVPEMVGFFEMPPTLPAWIAAAVHLVILRPLAEGLVFFGVAFPWLRARLGAWSGLVVMALLFALYHFAVFMFLAPQRPTIDFPAAWYGIFAPLLAGLVLGLLRAYTGSTRAVIAAYVGFGLFAVIKFAVVGG